MTPPAMSAQAEQLQADRADSPTDLEHGRPSPAVPGREVDHLAGGRLHFRLSLIPYFFETM